MKSHNAMRDEEAVDASWEAARGAAYGAIKWGAVTAALGGVGYALSPLYRGLTIQFKVYIQMSGMVFGGMIEADYRLREYEARVRMQKRIQRDRAMWQKFEDQYGKDDEE
ncbi:hypothetical protein CONLIGDRAFT_680584 [Coniochaeta ligniaria NRRL 30616]|uniref:Imidazoleglycerol-phosphate dehydratase n=1 Tax=Coniochaeta ligniaria NRRL 30616 TaxID=1408157 RepID=A0A1J7J904_9PEZI|nr:hypothetical protein CONLIGDRAFT_680584 [Coniochaeta ligniaria NRRL 30616]